MEVDYTLYHPHFNKYGLGSGYESFNIFTGVFNNEFHVNIPKGLQIVENGVEIEVWGKKTNKDAHDYKSFKASEDEIESNIPMNDTRYTIITKNKGVNDSNDYYSQFLEEHPVDNVLYFSYKTKNNPFYYLINAFSVAVFLLNIVIFVLEKRLILV